MKSYYYCYRPAGFNAPQVKHECFTAAQIEAERLAAKYPGETIEILQCIAISKIVAPAITVFMAGCEPANAATDKTWP